MRTGNLDLDAGAIVDVWVKARWSCRSRFIAFENSDEARSRQPHVSGVLLIPCPGGDRLLDERLFRWWSGLSLFEVKR